MDIKKTALYLVGGLYFLLFSAACSCNHPGSGVTQAPEGPTQQEQQTVAAPASYSAEAPGTVDDGTVIDEGTTEVTSSTEGTEVYDGSTEVVSGSSDEGTVIDDGSTEVVSGSVDEGTVIDDGSSVPVEGTPADGTPVME